MKKNFHSGELYSNKLDHREIGKEHNLFSFHEEGPGLPFFHEKGLAIKNQLVDLWRKEHKLFGYEEIQSPLMLDKVLWQQSGHWELFKDSMYLSEVEKIDFAIYFCNDADYDYLIVLAYEVP